MLKNYYIVVLLGDGIGSEVMIQVLKVLDVVCNCFVMCIIISYYDVGGVVIDNYG